MIGGFITFLVKSDFIYGQLLFYLLLVLHLRFLLHLWVIQPLLSHFQVTRKVNVV